MNTPFIDLHNSIYYYVNQSSLLEIGSNRFLSSYVIDFSSKLTILYTPKVYFLFSLTISLASSTKASTDILLETNVASSFPA